MTTAVSPRRRASPARPLALITLALLGLLGAAPARAQAELRPVAHELYLSRGVFSGPTDGDAWGPRWMMDHPQAEQRLLVAIDRLTRIDAYPFENALGFADPELGDFPFLYVAEVGAMRLDEAEREGLRRYLLNGGFLVVDDFWGTWAWQGFEAQMQRVLPEYRSVDVPLGHPLFHAFFDISEVLQVPNVALAGTGRTHEYDGYVPHVRAIFDDAGRLMVLMNWNTDLGDAWEWADEPSYPLRYSNYAFELGINIVVYAMSH